MPPLLSVSSFVMLPKPKVAFFSLYFATLQYLCGWFVFFFPQFARDSTVYVYKLNEDEMIILYKHTQEQSVQPRRLAHSQHKPGRPVTVQKEDLRNCVGPHTIPRSVESPIKQLMSHLSVLALFFLEVGWLYRWNSAS